MSAGTSASFCLIVYFLVCSSSEAQINITAELGQEVILPCKVPNTYILITAVVWSRPDQEPEYVLFYRDGHFVPYNQHPSYQNRVDLKDKEMKDGDFSLILKNVMMEDRGRYECRVFEEGKIDPISIFNLEVRAPTNIPAVLGQDVILPCKVPNNINIIAVEWIRPDQDPEYVLFYRDGRLDPDSQHPSYQNRVDLLDKDMKDGDFSLILKDVMMYDTGRYECRVYQRSKFEIINIINLEVHLSEGHKAELDGGDMDGGDKDGGDMDGILVGSVVGLILLLAVLVSVGFLIYRLLRQNQKLSVPLKDHCR